MEFLTVLPFSLPLPHLVSLKCGTRGKKEGREKKNSISSSAGDSLPFPPLSTAWEGGGGGGGGGKKKGMGRGAQKALFLSYTFGCRGGLLLGTKGKGGKGKKEEKKKGGGNIYRGSPSMRNFLPLVLLAPLCPSRQRRKKKKGRRGRKGKGKRFRANGFINSSYDSGSRLSGGHIWRKKEKKRGKGEEKRSNMASSRDCIPCSLGEKKKRKKGSRTNTHQVFFGLAIRFFFGAANVTKEGGKRSLFARPPRVLLLETQEEKKKKKKKGKGKGGGLRRESQGSVPPLIRVGGRSALEKRKKGKAFSTPLPLSRPGPGPSGGKERGKKKPR